MKKKRKIFSVVLVLVLFVPLQLVAQQFIWSRYDTTAYGCNPGTALAVGNNGWTYTNWLLHSGMNFNLQVYGSQSLNTFDSTGNLLSTRQLGPLAAVKSITVNASGEVMVSGSFMDTLTLDSIPLLLVNSPALYTVNAFLICFSPNGNINWTRNLSNSFSGMEQAAVVAADANGRFWFAHQNYFSGGHLICLDSSGNDSIVYPLPPDIAIVSDIAIDRSGCSYLAGALGQSTFTVGGLNVSTPNAYNKFLAKFSPAGDCRWFRTFRDVTFDHPMISIDDSANVYFASNLFDSVTVDSYFLAGPQWVYDFMLVKFDSSGTVSWANDVPQQSSITGDLEIAQTKSIAATSDGCRLLVSTRGQVDLGNGVTAGTGQFPAQPGMSVVNYNCNGAPQSTLEVSCQNGIYPQSIWYKNNSGFIALHAAGNLQVGQDSIQGNGPFTCSTILTHIDDAVTTGIHPVTEQAKNIRYVNPSYDGCLHIIVPAGEFTVRITNLVGQTVYSCSLVATQAVSSITTGLPPGLYCVSIGKSTFRWVVEK